MMDVNFAEMVLPLLIALAIGGFIYILLLPLLSGERKSNKRIKRIKRGGVTQDVKARAKAESGHQARRMQVQDTIKELEAQQKAKTNVTMRMRLERAGLNMTPNGFYLMSVLSALFVLFFIILTGFPLYIAIAAGAAAGFGAPRWLLNYLSKRRQKKFTEEFANAIDIIVRGVRSGLPLNDCLKIIAAEAQEPVKTEFIEVVEQLRIGLTISDALEKMYHRMPLEEVNFFGIVISIQQQAGGNLAEALGNLSGVLRDRKKLRGKIQAFSAEAKSSAAIIAALPFIVMLLVYMTTPDYISILWTHDTGQVLLGGCAVWMMMGVFIMAKMINFDY